MVGTPLPPTTTIKEEGVKHIKYTGELSKREESSNRGNQIIVIIFITILSCQQNEHNRKTKQKLNFASELTHSS